jgi:gliding motility-associated-like protein
MGLYSANMKNIFIMKKFLSHIRILIKLYVSLGQRKKTTSMKKSLLITAFALFLKLALFAQISSEIKYFRSGSSSQGSKNSFEVNTSTCPTPSFTITPKTLPCSPAGCSNLAVLDSANQSPQGFMSPGWKFTIGPIDNGIFNNQARLEVWQNGGIVASIGNNTIGDQSCPSCYIAPWQTWFQNNPGTLSVLLAEYQDPAITTELRMYYPSSDASFPWSLKDKFSNFQVAGGTFDFSTVTTGFLTTGGPYSKADGINQGTAVFTCATCPAGSWTDGQGGTATFCTPATPGKYGCTYSFSYGTCSKSFTDTITVTTTNNATWTSPPPVCALGTYNLNSYLSGSATTGGTWSGTNVSGNTFSPTGSGPVAITYSVGTGVCKAAQTHTITVLASPTVSTTSTPASCGQTNGTASTTVSGGTGPYTYSWSPSGGTGPTASNLAAGSYVVTVTDSKTCAKTASVTISNSNGPNTSIASQTNPGCAGGTGTVTVTASGGAAPYTYSWSNGNNTSAISAAAGTYTLTVTDATGCKSTQVATITQPAAITASVAATGASCGQSNGTAAASASGGTSPFTYNWSGGQATQNISGLTAGTYTVTIHDANGCTKAAPVVVNALGGPTATVNTTTTTIVAGSPLTLTATGGATYTWSPTTGLSCTTCSKPVARPTKTTIYCVTVKDSTGCSDSACVKIYVDDACGESFVPNAFSPNDDKFNDTFRPLPVGCYKEINFNIYNRWGNLMFSTTDLTKGWDGLSPDGQQCSDGVYFYTLKATFRDGSLIDKSGTVTLLK